MTTRSLVDGQLLLEEHPLQHPLVAHERARITRCCLAVVACASLGAAVAGVAFAAFFGSDPAYREFNFQPPRPLEQPDAGCADNPIARLVRLRLSHMRDELAAIRDASPSRLSAAHAAWRARHSCLRGVNLGSWLVLERWLLTPGETIETLSGTIASPFTGERLSAARDEFTLSRLLRARGELGRLEAFRERFVTRRDFEHLVRLGIKTVRIPFGYWLVSQNDTTPYIRGRGVEYLDRALAWAEELGLFVLLDLHAAPGGQSGEQQSGHVDAGWRPSDFDADASVEVVRLVARRYVNRRVLIGIELLNEPTLPAQLALSYYARAIAAVRQEGMRAEDVAIVINLYDMSRLLSPDSVWRALLAGLPPAENVVADLHLYYAFLPPLLDQLPLCFVVGELVNRQTEWLGLLGFPTLVGEWSLRVPWHGPQAAEFRALPPNQQAELLAAFGRRQIAAIASQNNSVGGFFWTWAAPSSEEQWGYRNAIDNGWLAREAWPGSCV